MHRKEYLIRMEPVGHTPYDFHIKEPKKEEIIAFPLGKYIKLEDSRTVFMIKKEYYRIFLDGHHSFKGHISLSPKTMNIVQHAEVSYSSNNRGKKKLKYVLKTGTPQKIEKEFRNYLNLHTINIKTLYPIGYVINKHSNESASSMHFTKLESDVIPLSAIEFSSLLVEDRLRYIQSIAEILATLHFHGYTHNDPKLKNFLFKRNTETILILDLVKMNYSRVPLILDVEHKLSSPKMQAIRYDFLNILGNAAYSKMIRKVDDILFFLRSYLKTQYKLSMKSRIKKGKPHQLNLFIADILSTISLHKSDKNIANIIDVFRSDKNASDIGIKMSSESDPYQQSLFEIDYISPDKKIESDTNTKTKDDGICKD